VHGHTKEEKSERLFIPNNGTPIFPDNSTKWIRQFSELHGKNHFTLHNLRHPYVKPTTKIDVLQKQKSQTINGDDNLGFLYNYVAYRKQNIISIMVS